jgi:spore germination protein YaaH
LKAQLERAGQNGLGAKIPFLDSFRASVDSHIYQLQPNAGITETAEEKERRLNATNNLTAAVVLSKQEAQAQISYFAQNGFKTTTEFFGFSANFKDPDFVATLDELPEKEKKELAQKMVDSYNELDEKKKKDYLIQNPEAVEWLKKQGFDLSKNQNLEQIKESVRQIGGDKAAEQAAVLQVKNENVENLVGDKSREFDGMARNVAKASDEQLVAENSVQSTVYKAAEEKGLDNRKADFEKEEDADLAMFGSVVADAAKQLQRSGMEPESKALAPKPTEVLVADSSKVSDVGRGAQV